MLFYLLVTTFCRQKYRPSREIPYFLVQWSRFIDKIRFSIYIPLLKCDLHVDKPFQPQSLTGGNPLPFYHYYFDDSRSDFAGPFFPDHFRYPFLFDNAPRVPTFRIFNEHNIDQSCERNGTTKGRLAITYSKQNFRV